jgi:DNA polymerase III epsilon subunit family exonuclease
MSASIDRDESPRYEFLARRATDYLREHGGRVREDDLIRHVFGGSSSATLWAPLLRGALAHEPLLEQLPDGSWSLVGSTIGTHGTVLRDFIALDVETTGLRPLTNRIIEIAAIRFRDGMESERFVTYLQPDKKLPSVIVNLTGIRDADLVDAPYFRDIADDLGDFLADELVVGHNVGFDLSFVAAEMKRIARPGIANQRFDTMTAARRLLPTLRKKNLSKLAEHLGIPDGREHRAYDDAFRTAQVAMKLGEIAESNGVAEASQVLALGAPLPRASTDGNPHRRNVLDRSILVGIPRTPGVYVMRDGFDQVVYIGKAKNLRDRVGSYFSQALGYTRKMDGLLESISTIRVEETGSELQALLLEAQLIRFYQPRFNTALRASESYPYIRINIGNLWPRVSLTKERKDDGSVYFGPYRSRSTASRVVDVIHRVLPLRTCPRSFKDAQSFGRACLRLDLHQCLGPCMGVADRGEYLRHVRSVLKFLDGDASDINEHLLQQIAAAAAKLDFERAHQLRADLALIESVAVAQAEMSYATTHHHALVVLPASERGSRTVQMVLNGGLWASFTVKTDDNPRDVGVRLARSFARFLVAPPTKPDHSSIDDAIILNRCLRKQSGHAAILPLSLEDGAIDWLAMAEQVAALAESDLLIDITPAPDPEAAEARSEEQLEREQALRAAVRAQAFAEAGDSA